MNLPFRSKNFYPLGEHYPRIVLFDTETSGLDFDRDRIIEISLVVIEGGEVSNAQDIFVHFDGKLPEKIVELTGITDEKLFRDGIEEWDMAMRIRPLLHQTPCLLVAHNANFDLQFLIKLFQRTHIACDMTQVDFLDTLTVYKDRAPYPHKLCNAITNYGLDDIVVNSHSALDDVYAMAMVLDAMLLEKDDILQYINLFGYNPKYPLLPIHELERVNYLPQPYSARHPLYLS